MNIYKAHDISYRIATKKDEAVLKRLLNKNVMDSWVNITLRKEPNYFDADTLMGESITVIAHKTEDETAVIGMYACTLFKLFFSGKKESIIYLNSLRINPYFRHKIRFLKEGFNSINKVISFKATVPFMVTSIASENFNAKRMLESNLKGMPRYVPLAQMSSFSFLARQNKDPLLSSRANSSDVISMLKFYHSVSRCYDFAPVLDESWLRTLDGSKGLNIEDFFIVKNPDGEIEAMFALWDQRKIKQVVIESYRAPLDRFRSIYNLYAKISANLILPKEGDALQQVFISFFVTLSKDTGWVLKILKEASSLIAEKNADFCTIGFSSNDPFCTIMRDKLKAKEYKTDIEAVFLSSATQSEINISHLKPEIALL